MRDRSPMRALVALLAWAGVLLQLYVNVRRSFADGEGVGRALFLYFGTLTILTNVLVATAFTVSRGFLTRPWVLSGVTTSIVFVGIAYHLLLSGTSEPTGLNYVSDLLLHYLTPAAVLAYWVVQVPKADLRWSHVGLWTLYPVGYATYMLVRGELTGHYPYYFVDAPELGYGQVFLNAGGILVGFVVLGTGLVGTARTVARRTGTMAPDPTP